MENNEAEFKEALELACQASNLSKIEEGRKKLLLLNKEILIQNIIESASTILNLQDSWEYRRLIEVCVLIDKDLVKRIVELGIGSCNEEVREAANEYM